MGRHMTQSKKRRELKMQGHIVDSYKMVGGEALKINPSWNAGIGDLLCSLPGVGCHIIEVKHRPTFGPEYRGAVKNSMTELQKDRAKKWLAAGTPYLLCIVGGSSQARGSCLTLVDPLADDVDSNLVHWWPYRLGAKYDVHGAVTRIIDPNSGPRFL